MFDTFTNLPDHASLWVYALNRDLTEDDIQDASDILDDFVAQWKSHGVPVDGAYEIFEDRFIIISGYCTDGVSGCSTDASVRVVKDIEQKIGVDAFDRTLVFFRNGGGKLVSVSRADFQELVKQKHIIPDTPVFDTTITTLESLRQGRFETTFEKSWHARAFSIR